ncbi:MAG: hypothetical protein ABSB19_11345 [Methylomonas sp.]
MNTQQPVKIAAISSIFTLGIFLALSGEFILSSALLCLASIASNLGSRREIIAEPIRDIRPAID